MSVCTSANGCPFYEAVEASIVKRIRFAAMFPYCNGGKSVQCAIREQLLLNREPEAHLLPDGSRGDYKADTVSHAVSPKTPAATSSERFLIIEDSPIFSGYAANAIRHTYPKSDVVECRTFQDAEKALRAGRFNLVVSGFGLDDGKTVHDIRRLTDLPIVLLTGRPDHDVSTLGRVHMVQKGSSFEAMRGALGALLGA